MIWHITFAASPVFLGLTVLPLKIDGLLSTTGSFTDSKLQFYRQNFTADN